MTPFPKAFPNSTTTVDVEKSVAVIESYLVKMGADQVLKQYGEIGGVRACIQVLAADPEGLAALALFGWKA